MSDTTANQTALDPNRPWITDEQELPSRMSWVGALFNPTGTSPKLHFTRVWTVCFFLQLLIVVIPVSVGILVGLAGGDASLLRTAGLYASPVIFIITTIISFVAHSRRLNDAGKLSFGAVIVLVPMVVGLTIFTMGVISKAADYDGLYQKRAEYLSDPQTWRAERLAERKKRQTRETGVRDFNSGAKLFVSSVYYGKDPEMRTDTEAWRMRTLAEYSRLREAALTLAPKSTDQATDGKPKNPERRRGGGPGGSNTIRADQPLPSQGDYILKPNVGVIQRTLILMNIFIVMWSLLRVARFPSAGRDVR